MVRGRDDLYNINSDPPLPLIVASRQELAQALRQHALPIIIRDKKLARPFEVLWWAQQNWWAVVMAIIIAYAISQRYGVTFKHTEWKTGVTTQDEIVLTPTRPQSPFGTAPGGEE